MTKRLNIRSRGRPAFRRQFQFGGTVMDRIVKFVALALTCVAVMLAAGCPMTTKDGGGNCTPPASCLGNQQFQLALGTSGVADPCPYQAVAVVCSNCKLVSLTVNGAAGTHRPTEATFDWNGTISARTATPGPGG